MTALSPPVPPPMPPKYPFLPETWREKEGLAGRELTQDRKVRTEARLAPSSLDFLSLRAGFVGGKSLKPPQTCLCVCKRCLHLCTDGILSTPASSSFLFCEQPVNSSFLDGPPLLPLSPHLQ